MNRSDSERIAAVFEGAGCLPAKDMVSADIAIVTMCSVRRMATDRVFGLEQKFRQIRKHNPDFIGIVTGCVVDSDKKRLSGIFDHILNINTLAGWPRIAKKNSKCVRLNGYFEASPKRTQPWSVLIPISQGCDNYCSYCVVPYARGPLVCRSWQSIISESKIAVGQGAREIWLLGQNVNNFHSGKVNFAGLLRLVNDIPGDFWIRFTSPHPKDFGSEAVLAMAECRKVTPYLNLPVQSGDDDVLRAMKRPYTVAGYKLLVAALRRAFREQRRGMEAQLAVSTDVIVGFPGETREQFSNTLKTFKAIKYDMAYIAEYSQRHGTAAFRITDNVTPYEKERRQRAVNNVLKVTALAHNKKYVGKTVEVLVDEIKAGDSGFGKTRSYKTVKFGIKGNRVVLGDFVKVKITGAKPFGLSGNLTDEK